MTKIEQRHSRQGGIKLQLVIEPLCSVVLILRVFCDIAIRTRPCFRSFHFKHYPNQESIISAQSLLYNLSPDNYLGIEEDNLLPTKFNLVTGLS